MNACKSAEEYSYLDFNGACCQAVTVLWLGYYHEGPCCEDPNCGDCPQALVSLRRPAIEEVL